MNPATSRSSACCATGILSPRGRCRRPSSMNEGCRSVARGHCGSWPHLRRLRLVANYIQTKGRAHALFPARPELALCYRSPNLLLLFGGWHPGDQVPHGRGQERTPHFGTLLLVPELRGWIGSLQCALGERN